jgi:hypothetical protein
MLVKSAVLSTILPPLLSALVAAAPQYGWSNVTSMTDGAQTATATDGGAWAVTETANALAVATAALSTNSSSFPAPSTFENVAGPPLAAQDLHWTALGDSWASGVTYKHDPSLDWTAPRDENCRSILDAYAV